MVSVIIPSLNSPLIDQVIDALERQTVHDQIREVIVVGQDRYGRVPPQVRFIPTPQPISAAAARNMGAQLASGSYLLFIDSDCIAAPDLVERVLACHAQGHVVVCGGVALESGDYWIECDNLLAFAPFLSATPAGPRPYLLSLNFSIGRELFMALGGFDERFPGAAGEDIDIGWRLRQQGHSLFFEPRAVVYHRPQRSSAGAIWAHLRSFGQSQSILWRLFPDLENTRRKRRLRPFAGLIIAVAPLLALRDALALYRRSLSLRSFVRLAPGLVWGKTAWYWGVAEALWVDRGRERAPAGSTENHKKSL
jgi:GT2 family glycosyltransferase